MQREREREREKRERRREKGKEERRKKIGTLTFTRCTTRSTLWNVHACTWPWFLKPWKHLAVVSG